MIKLHNFSVNKTAFINRNKNKLSFGIEPKPEEKAEMEVTLRNAYEVANKKPVFIVPASAIPSKTGMGSPFSQQARELDSFVRTQGMSGFNWLPMGDTKKEDPSPYESSGVIKSSLLIDLQQLSDPEWGQILPADEYSRVVQNVQADKSDDNLIRKQFQTRTENILADGNLQDWERQESLKDIKGSMHEYAKGTPNIVKYTAAQTAYLGKPDENGKKGALRVAFDNFQRGSQTDPRLQALRREYEAYKQRKGQLLEKNGVYEVLTRKYGNDYYPNWQDDVDAHLYTYIGDPSNPKHQEALQRRQQYLSDSETRKEIEFQSFCQFVFDKEKEGAVKFKNEQDKISSQRVGHEVKRIDIADVLLGSHPKDIWFNEPAFLPPDQFSGTWGLPVPNPQALFTADGKLGPTGEMLASKIDVPLEPTPEGRFFNGIRMDAATRLYDMPVYGEGVQKQGNWLSSELGEAGKDYKRIIPEIVRPAIQKNDVPPANVAMEALADYPDMGNRDWRQAFYQEVLGEDLRPIAQSLWNERLEGQPVNRFAVITSHDQPSMDVLLRETRDTDPDQIDKMINPYRDNYLKNQRRDDDIRNGQQTWHLSYLAGYTMPPGYEGGMEAYKEKLATDATEFKKAKMVELFLSNPETVGIPFTELLQMQDAYNNRQPGLINWRLTLPENYQQVFYAKAEKDEAINLPEIMRRTLEIKQVREGKDYSQHIEALKKYEGILKTPTPEDQLDPSVRSYLEYEQKIKNNQSPTTVTNSQSLKLAG